MLNINLNSGTGKILSQTNGKLWYDVGTWPNNDTWLDVVQANDFLDNKVGKGKSRFVRERVQS